MGNIFNQFWEVKKILARGAEPPSVAKLFEAVRSLAVGQVI